MPVKLETPMTIGQALARLEALAVQSAEIAHEQDLLRALIETPSAHNEALSSKPNSGRRKRATTEAVDDRQRLILALMKAGPISRQALVRETGHTPNRVWHDVFRLLSRGLIRRVGEGIYVLVENPTPELKTVTRSPQRNHAPNPDVQPRRQKLLALMKDGQKRRKDLIKESGVKASRVDNDMIVFMKKGVVVRVRPAMYELAKTNHASEG